MILLLMAVTLTAAAFAKGPVGDWQKNLLTSVTRPGASAGQVLVEQFTYTQDIFANVATHTTYTGAGVPRTTNPSGRGSIRTPIARIAAVTVSMRSDSFARSSSAPDTTVSP